jgi:hypothetical protein
MTEKRFFVSKISVFIALVSVILCTAVILFLWWVTYIIGDQYEASPEFLFILRFISACFGVVCGLFWFKIFALIRRRNEPVISFMADSVTYQTSNVWTVSIPLSEIWGVEVEQLSPKAGGGHILIRRSNSQIDKIPVMILDASYTEVFLAFKERVPNLHQPYSTVERLKRRA